MTTILDEPTLDPAGLVWVAWRRYLRVTRACPQEEYEATEDAAWRRLRVDLAAAGSPLPGQDAR